MRHALCSCVHVLYWMRCEGSVPAPDMVLLLSAPLVQGRLQAGRELPRRRAGRRVGFCCGVTAI